MPRGAHDLVVARPACPARLQFVDNIAPCHCHRPTRVIFVTMQPRTSLWVMSETDVIHTPDQRVRVFVSSTLTELAAERQAVRDAVTSLRLVPVLFELGARPYPPRPVYRSYLAQSQVFVG